jgi:hypothetical protein
VSFQEVIRQDYPMSSWLVNAAVPTVGEQPAVE